MTTTNNITRLVFLLVLSSSLVAHGAQSSPAAARQGPASKQLRSKSLPRTHHRVVHRGTPYYFWGGHFYRQSSGVYVSITAPIGAIVPSLPGGFITIGTGPRRYYYYAGAYYRPATKGFVVIEQPSTTPTVLPAEDSGRIIVYPAAGQSEEQTGRDRYECHLWASKETDFDPTVADSDSNLRSDYRRAMNACLEARDYVVK
ncbi:DUF6515 family protein [Congregibacter brevis]|uniref:DUF6515 family protein n=1 Tax=Congregibacter brevis TaxID=3081201 RepID=A0ABZ0IFB2_9GAMM|nr:DUF6515 family protein [Congregibacter sp. IMCC45268]